MQLTRVGFTDALPALAALGLIGAWTLRR